MLPFTILSPRDVAQALAGRVKRLRLAREWTQEELAQRAGITLASYRRFETSGRVSLERLLKVALVLDALAQFEQLFTAPPPKTLAELEETKVRRRGKRRDAKT